MATHALMISLAVIFLAAFTRPAAAQRSWDGGNGTFVWGDNGNWSPDGPPGGVAISIGNLAAAANDTTLLDTGYTITSLTITNGADVVTSTDNGATNDFQLLVNGLTTIGDAGSTFFVIGGDTDGLDTEGLTLNSGGTLNLNSTTAQGTAIVEIESGLLDINSGGTIIGQGRIDLEDVLAAPTSVLINDGTITASTPTLLIFQGPAAGTLQIAALDVDARFDWDGLGNGVLQVNGNQTLDIDVTPGAGAGSDAFSGTMNLNTGSTIDIAVPWSLDSGTINANTAAFGFVVIGQDPNPGPAARIVGGTWTMTGGTINTPDSWDSLQFDSALSASGGTVNNEGTLIFNANATFFSAVDFNMNGAQSSLVVNAATVNIDTPDFSLDGVGGGGSTTINAGGVLDLNVGVGADVSYDHTINLNGGELDFTSSAVTSWSLTGTGVINAGGGLTSRINSIGETLNINGDVNVTANSTLNVSSTTAFVATSAVAVESGSSFDVTIATYNGGSYTGAGTFRKGSATIALPTTWSVARLDLDDGATVLNANLTINADTLEPDGDGVDLTHTINDSALLTVNLTGGAEWTLDAGGSLVYNGNATPDSYLAGSDVNVNGTINHNGDGRIDARLDVGSAGAVNILTAVEPLRLSGGTLATPNTIAGGTINGPGILGADADTALRGFGVINATVDFDGSAELVATGGVLDFNSFATDLGTLRTDGAAAVIDLANPFTTNVTDNGVIMAGGTIQGAALISAALTRPIRGFGTVTSAVDNNGLIDARDGTLLLNNPAGDYDGTAGNVGTLRAFSGTLEIVDNATFNFAGSVEVFTNRELFANGFELNYLAAATVELSAGGRLRSTHEGNLVGQLETLAGGSPAVIEMPEFGFQAAAVVTLNNSLLLDTTLTQIAAGATFSGGAELINGAGSTLRMQDNADVDVLVQNQGVLELGLIGAINAQVTGADFQQDATGEWAVTLGGTGLSQFDRLTLTGAASLAGELSLSLVDGYVPALGNVLPLLSAPGSVLGQFTAVTQPAGMPAGLLFDVVYSATLVQLQVVNAPIFSADFDLDGDVDSDDLAQWQGDYGVNDLSDADNDGDSDGADFLAWQQQLGSVPAVPATGAVPEPGGLSLALTIVCGLMIRVIRRRS